AILFPLHFTKRALLLHPRPRTATTDCNSITPISPRLAAALHPTTNPCREKFPIAAAISNANWKFCSPKQSWPSAKSPGTLTSKSSSSAASSPRARFINSPTAQKPKSRPALRAYSASIIPASKTRKPPASLPLCMPKSSPTSAASSNTSTFHLHYPWIRKDSRLPCRVSRVSRVLAELIRHRGPPVVATFSARSSAASWRRDLLLDLESKPNRRLSAAPYGLLMGIPDSQPRPSHRR